MNNDYFIYLNVEMYLKQFLEHHFGDPVCLPEKSPEHDLIFRLLQQNWKAPAPDMGEDSNLSIRIPCFAKKNPRIFNYFSASAKRALYSSLYSFFNAKLWKEMNDLSRSGGIRKYLIEAWMDKNGISLDYWDTISQKYYRMCKRYEKEMLKEEVI